MVQFDKTWFSVIYSFGYPVRSFKVHKEKEIMEQLIFQSCNKSLQLWKCEQKEKMKEIAVVSNFLEFIE